MKTLIQLVMVALIVGGLSAAVTVFTQVKTAVPTLASAETDAPKTSEPAKPDHTVSSAAPAERERSEPDEGNHSEATVLDEKTAAPAVITEKLDNLPLNSEPHPPAPALPSPHGDSRNPLLPVEAGKPKEVPVAVRPAYVPEGDEAGALINLLRERSRNTADVERRLAERQDAMQMIFDDLRAEQTRTLKIRQRLSSELKASRESLDTALQIIDEERVAMQRDQAATRKAAEDAVRAANEERDKLRKQMEQPATTNPADAARSNDTAGSPEDNVNLKKMAAVFDSMPAENVSKVFEQLVKNKRPDAVVALMNAMKERQAAKVLGIIAETNSELAADLTERLKRLKMSTAKPVAE